MFRDFLSRLSLNFRFTFPRIDSRLVLFALFALLLASMPVLSAVADTGGGDSTDLGGQEDEIELEPDPVNFNQGGASWYGGDGGSSGTEDPGFGDQEDEIELEPDPLISGAPSWLSELTAYFTALFTRW